MERGGRDEANALDLLLEILERHASAYCVIDGLAVNAYAEPVVSLDLDIVVASEDLEAVVTAAAAQGFKAESFPHSVNLEHPNSDLRIQFQTDPRYRDFPARAARASVLGHTLRVAAVEDVLQGKLWAYSDGERRKSKRQKDLADILRLVEAHPKLEALLPHGLL